MAENTTASAEGNAAAQLYVRVTNSPDENPFKNSLLPEEVDRHFYFNDDILEQAERIDEFTAEINRLRDVDLPLVDLQLEEAAASEGLIDPGNATRTRSLIFDFIAEREENILRCEDRIFVEIQTVRDEYAAVAEALNSDRKDDFVRDYEIYEQLLEGRREAIRQFNETHNFQPGDPGYDDPDPAASLQGSHFAHHVQRYERTYANYRFLEEGLAITTLREALMSIVWGGVSLIATEIITAGIAKYVTIGVMALRATRIGEAATDVAGRAATEVAGRATKLIMGRYQALSPGTKARLDRLRQIARNADEPPAQPRDGATTSGTGPVQVTRTCRTGACR